MKIHTDPSTKPYYRCLSCPKFRNVCGGIPTRGMDLKDWCEYMLDVRNAFHLSNAYIEEHSKVSTKTIERIMAINCSQDIMRATARHIEMAIIGPVTRHLCEMDYDTTAADRIAELEKKLAEMKEDRDMLAQIIKQFINKDK